MPKLFIIDETWQKHPWYSTGGTRAKEYLADAEGKYYYFKRSQYKPAAAGKPEKNFKYEFWSEIVAYEVGSRLGFDVLPYYLAIDKEGPGCICASMINSDKEELIEGIKYLQAFDNSFDPEKTEQRNRYTFQLIDHALSQFKLGAYIEYLMETFVFDCIIGNGDRHQENWAVISEYGPTALGVNEIMADFPTLRQTKHHWQHKLLDVIAALYRDKKSKEDLKRLKLNATNDKIRFAPIYDNGSSLGRELTDERVNELVQSDAKVNRYIENGLSEIHWEGNSKKLSHFAFLTKLQESSYCETIEEIIKRVVTRFSEQEVKQVVYNVDDSLPESYREYMIPLNRKELIVKLITLRIKKLGALIHEGV
ncbi:MAG: hypothetical protein V4649_03880 [Bacteroidota bacterium]